MVPGEFLRSGVAGYGSKRSKEKRQAEEVNRQDGSSQRIATAVQQWVGKNFQMNRSW
jgi:hypothetical protein